MEDRKRKWVKRKASNKKSSPFQFARERAASQPCADFSRGVTRMGRGEEGLWCNASQVTDEVPVLVETAETLRPWHWERVSKMVSDLTSYVPVRVALLLFLIGLTDIFLSWNQNVSHHLRQSICSQGPHSCSMDAALFKNQKIKNSFISRDAMQWRGKHLSS